MQRHDFAELFHHHERAAGDDPTARPPLHEFLPHTAAEVDEVAKAMNTTGEKLKRRARELHEFNPMSGLRGCRPGDRLSEIAEMQGPRILRLRSRPESDRRRGRARIMVSAGGLPGRVDLVKERLDAMARARREGDWNQRLVPSRHDDRGCRAPA
jgi:pyruvate,orthophosphate dikinase